MSNPAKPIDQQLADIKAHMPETYKAILAKAGRVLDANGRPALDAAGKPAYTNPKAFTLVRRGLRGEANCFYAFEHGLVVGTPFTLTEVARDIAQYMVTFGISHVCVWAEPDLPAAQPTTASNT